MRKARVQRRGREVVDVIWRKKYICADSSWSRCSLPTLRGEQLCTLCSCTRAYIESSIANLADDESPPPPFDYRVQRGHHIAETAFSICPHCDCELARARERLFHIDSHRNVHPCFGPISIYRHYGGLRSSYSLYSMNKSSETVLLINLSRKSPTARYIIGFSFVLPKYFSLNVLLHIRYIKHMLHVLHR